MPTGKIEDTMGPAELGGLLHVCNTSPRRQQKRYLLNLGGSGSAAELDRVLAIASESKAAIRFAEKLASQQTQESLLTEEGIAMQADAVRAEIGRQMEKQGITQVELARRCGIAQSVVSLYLNGKKEPGLGRLLEIITALDCEWVIRKKRRKTS